MTQTIQPGQHPDADQLSAFAEHALPPHEQQQLLAHLAACSDCRALVFLAQEAVPAAATLPQPVAAHRPWFSFFSGWRLALPIAALGCLVLVTVHLHNQAMEGSKTAIVDKTARLEQAPPPASPPPPQQPAALKIVPAEAQKAAPIAAPNASRLDSETAATGTVAGASTFHGNAQPLGLGGMGGRGASVSADELKSVNSSRQSSFGMTNFTAGNPAPAAAPVTLGGALAGPLPQAAGLAAGAVSPQSAADTATALPRTVPSSTATLHSLNRQYSAVPPLPPPPPQSQAATPAKAPGMAGGIGATTETVTVNSAPVSLETESNASSTVITGESLGSLQSSRTLMRKKEAALPSRLPVVSTTSNGRQQLALDTAGALFRSEDAGVTWRLVAVQWTGRVVNLAVASTSNSALAKDGIATAAAAKAAPSPPQLFQLTNDAGQLWTSPDGQTWKRK